MGFRIKTSNNPDCNCNCDNCQDSDMCYYSSYHCEHAEHGSGDCESQGYCAKTGFVPKHSWLRSHKIPKKIRRPHLQEAKKLNPDLTW